MTKLWGKLVDTDGDGNKEVLQLSDDDPTTLFTPEACQFWKEIPEGTAIGSVLEAATQKWWTGAAWLEKRIAESPPPGDPDIAPQPLLRDGEVTAVSITSPGSNYADANARDQYDIDEGQGLVVEVFYNQDTGQATSATIHNGGWGYTVGQTFTVKRGMDMLAWDRKNPTWTVLTITAVHTS